MNKNELKPKIKLKNSDDNWKENTIGKIGSIAMCKRVFKEQTKEKGEIPFFKIGTFGGVPDAYISKELFNELKNKYRYPENGAILISASGTIGRAVEYSGKDEYFQDSNIVWIEHNDEVVDKFLKYYIEIVEWNGLEGSTIKRLYNSNILNTIIRYPNNKIQKQIGELFDNVDSIINEYKEQVEKWKNIRTSLLSKMFPREGQKVPEIRFKDFSGEWEDVKLKDVVQIERGGSPRPIQDYITYDSNGLNWVKIGDAPKFGNYITSTKEKIKVEGLSKTKEVHCGDLILSNSMSFGRPYIMSIDGCIHDGWLLIRNYKNVFDIKFLCMLLSTPYMYSQYKSFAAGSTVNNLNKEIVGNSIIRIPKEISEQKLIGDFFEIIDKEIEMCQQRSNMLENLRKSFLDKMFV